MLWLRSRTELVATGEDTDLGEDGQSPRKLQEVLASRGEVWRPPVVGDDIGDLAPQKMDLFLSPPSRTTQKLRQHLTVSQGPRYPQKQAQSEHSDLPAKCKDESRKLTPSLGFFKISTIDILDPDLSFITRHLTRVALSLICSVTKTRALSVTGANHIPNNWPYSKFTLSNL